MNKTFDKALAFLEQNNFTEADAKKILVQPNEPIDSETLDLLNRLGKEFLSGMKITLISNEHYYGMVFNAAIYHLAHKNGGKSFFDTALSIIRSANPLLCEKDERYENTDYPKHLVDQFISYCDELEDCPVFLSEAGGFRTSLFFVAWHYEVDAKA